MNYLKNSIMLAVPAALFVAAPAYAQDAGQAPAAEAKTETKVKKKKKITDRSHPDYVRCRNMSVIGSLARKRRVCMTNKEWKEASARGNQGARDIVDTAGQGGMRSE